MTTFVDPGVLPDALPMTSIVVFPRCRLALAVKTPLPTAAGCPWTSTVAPGGSTVPRTATLLALITVPLAGEVTWTVTTPEATVLVDVVVDDDDPHPTSPVSAMAPSAIKETRPIWAPIQKTLFR
jgi:hypothetical protein